MTDADVYVILVAGVAVITIAAWAGWSIDRWHEWRARNEEHRLNAAARSADLVWHAYAFFYGGTVHCPADPSPTPRSAR